MVEVTDESIGLVSAETTTIDCSPTTVDVTSDDEVVFNEPTEDS